MPKYGFFRYGTTVYGNLLRETAQSQLLAQAIDYGKVRVTVMSGPRIGLGYVLIRTKNGSATDPAQGITVASGVIQSPEFSVLDGEDNLSDISFSNDVSVPSGSVFYTLFVITESGDWVRDAATSVFSPKDQGTLSVLLSMLPPVLTTSTGNPLDSPETTTDLARFLGGIAVTYDEFQTEVDALLPSSSRRSAVLRGFHESLARSVGMPIEFTVGVGASARLFRDAGFIYRQKGTLSGVRAFTEALTGWASEAYASPNMIRYLDDASFESSPGRWSATGADLESQLVGGEYNAPELPYDYLLSPFASDGIGLISLTTELATLELPALVADEPSTGLATNRTLANRLACIPVRAGSTYYLSVFVNPYVTQNESTITLAVEWLDQQGAILSTSVGAVQELSTSSGWERVSQAFLAPTSAAFAKLEIRLAGTEGDEIGIDSVQMARTEIHYHDPRAVTVICAPSRVNLLTDGNFTSGSAWTSITGSASRETNGLFGTHCLSLSGSTDFEAVSETIPVREDLLLNFSAYFQGDGAEVQVEYLDDEGAVLDAQNPSTLVPNQYAGSLTVAATDEWARFEVTALAPTAAESVRIRISGQGELRMDAALLERSERARIYFDADTADAAGEDTLVNPVGDHVYAMLYPGRLSRLSRLKATLPFYVAMGVPVRILLWDSDDPAVTDLLPYGV